MEFTSDQRKAFDLALGGENLFVTGGAGTGKTFLLQKVIQSLARLGKEVVICAPTGTAAIKVGGVTINRVFSLLAGPCINEKSMSLTVHCPATIKKADVVIIDEVSMCRMDMMDSIQKSIEKAEKQTKRHIQVIVVGDFFQLPPVINEDRGERTLLEKYYKRPIGRGYAFTGDGWNKFGFTSVVLTQIVRQKDREFVEQLNKSRFGDASSLDYFNSKVQHHPLADAVYLCGHNTTVNNMNSTMLEALAGESFTFNATIKGNVTPSDMMVPEEIVLKIGARIMLVINDVGGDYYNGSTGTVTAVMDETVFVRLDSNGKEIPVSSYTWNINRYVVDGETIMQETVGTYSQLPIKLAYAITIHKSQGAIFDRLNLNPKSWDSGQLYVALSRVKDISGLYLDGPLLRSYLKIDPMVKEFYDALTGGTANAVEIAEDIVERSQREIQAETAAVVEEVKKVMGRPRKYRGSSHTTRVPDEILEDVKTAIRVWSSDPDQMIVLTVPKEKLDEILRIIGK